MNVFKQYVYHSWAFNSDAFANEEQEEPKPVPSGIGEAGGWGGGGGVYVEDLPPDIWGVNAETTTLATALAKKLTDSDKITKNLVADPLRPKKARPDYELRRTIHDLRGRVASLEEALDKANRATMLPWRLYSNAVAEIGRLRASLTSVEAEQARLAGLVAAQQRTIADLESHRQEVQADPDAGIRYNLPVVSLPPFEEIWARALGDAEAPAAPAPRPFPWAEIAASAIGFLFSAFVLPRSWRLTRAFGYGVSSALGLSALRRALA